MTNAWFSFYPGDYLRDTADLSFDRHGAYLKLLCFYYSNERPLPTDKSALHRIAGAQDDQERAAVDFIVERFFTLSDGVYRHGRADREIVRRAEAHDRLSERGRRGASSRWQGKPDGTSNASAIGTSNASAVACPQPQPQPQEEKKHPAPSAPCESSNATALLEQETKGAAFEVFWERWPRKQAKGTARKAWLNIPIAEYPAVMTGLEKWLLSDQWAREVIPHPATWLNKKRWQDEDIPQLVERNDGNPNRKQSATDLAMQNARALGLNRVPN
jgi:uncharacterized protein YdaU (DUF1376 family)